MEEEQKEKEELRTALNLSKNKGKEIDEVTTLCTCTTHSCMSRVYNQLASSISIIVNENNIDTGW